MRSLTVGAQTLHFPTFLPVTTFGGKFPLDELVRPYLNRFFPACMVSYYYAKQMSKRPKGILFIDSGGFASLFDGAEYENRGSFSVIHTKEGDVISPPEVLAFQEKYADIGATVDFLIPPSCPIEEAVRRQKLTLDNAIWAIQNRVNPSLALYASVQAWDQESADHAIRALASHPFDGIALGGMVPRIKRPEEILAIVRAIRSVDRTRPLHVFGIGNAELIRALFREGVTSVDSSSWVRAAADGRYINPKSGKVQDVSSAEVKGCNCPSCKKLGADYLSLEGEGNCMALALHNLFALQALIHS